MTRLSRTLLAAGVAVAALGTAGAAPAQEPLKVAFVYVGPVGDFGWSYRHDVGRKAVEAAFGDAVETSFVESVPEGPDAERVIQQLVDAGNTLIFTTSFGYMEQTLAVAEFEPDVYFEHATGFKRLDNVSTYAGRFYEGRFIQGVIAGRLTKTNIGCYVGSFPIPEVVSGINAFTLGMRSVNPEATVKVAWVYSWYDPGKEAEATGALIDQGCDIVTQHTDSPAPVQTAANRGLLAFGQDSDMIDFAPNNQLTANINVWDQYYVDRVKAVMDGTWTSTDTWSGLETGILAMAPYRNMPDEVAAEAARIEASLAAHEMHVFEGPLLDQSGAEKLPAGTDLPDADILSMNWFVQGVDAQMPE